MTTAGLAFLFAGDRFGRGKAMVITNCLTALGAIGCALFAWKPFVFSAISACRFILGIGVGGKYPLTAMMRAEGTAKGEHGATEVSKGFFWQTPGSSDCIASSHLADAFLNGQAQ